MRYGVVFVTMCITILLVICFESFVGKDISLRTNFRRAINKLDVTESENKEAENSYEEPENLIDETDNSTDIREETEETTTQEFSSQFDKCPLPHRNPFEKEFMKAFGEKAEYPKSCVKDEELTVMKDGRVVMNEKYNGSEGFWCYARCIYYQSNYAVREDEYKYIEYIKEYNCDVIEVQCYPVNGTEWTYKTIHLQIKEYSRNRVKDFEDMGVDTETPKISKKNYHPNVFIIILDAMAMASTYRQMPETVVFLQQALQSIPFPHIAKSAVNSKPNSFAFLFGEIPITVDRSVYGNNQTLPPTLDEGETCDRPLDNESFVMFEYEDAGYKTMWGCDAALVTFGYTDCKGIVNQLTTHYMRPFQVRGTLYPDALLYKYLLKPEACRDTYDYLLRYQEMFINSYKDTPKLSLVWSSDASHETEKTMRQMDPRFREFLERNYDTLDESFVFVMGDHGPRYHSAINTNQGLFDRANPLMFLSLPRKLRGTEMHRIVEQNSKQLSSHHDLHATLADIIRHQPQTNFTDTSFRKINTHGSSWLRQFESGKPRSCRSLPIPAQYCICDYGEEKIRNETLIKELGVMVVKDINLYLKERKSEEDCEEMELKQVNEVLSIPVEGYKRRYRVQFETTRGAQLLATYVVKNDNTIGLLTKDWDRINRYGTDADCLTGDNSDIRTICYCRKRTTEA